MITMKLKIKKLAKICLSPVLLLNRLVKRTNWYMNAIPDLDNYPTNDWYRKNLSRNYELVLIGSSTGVYDFDLSVADIKTFNWSMQPLAMEYALKVLKNFFSILKKDGIVIIVFSPFSGLSALGKQGKTIDDRFYHLLDRTLVNNYEEVAKRRKYPLLYNPKEALKRLIRDVPKKARRNCNVCHTETEYEQDSKRWIEGWMREFEIYNLEAPLTEENTMGMKERSATIQEMVDFCLERDLRPLFVLPPIHPSLASKLSTTFRKNYIYSFIEQFTMQGIPFYNYLDSPAFNEDRFFSNAYFMSEEGAKAFTRTFLEDIGLIKGVLGDKGVDAVRGILKKK